MIPADILWNPHHARYDSPRHPALDAGYFVTPHSDAGSSCEPLVGNIGTYNPCVLKRGTSKETAQM